jgi:hypothetical protein
VDPADLASDARPVAASPSAEPVGARPSAWRYVIVALMLGFAAFWIWALFFASKESVNRIDDRAWAQRAEAICARAGAERQALADYRELDGSNAAMLAERGALVDRATDIVTEMLDDVVAVVPSDEKGQQLIPLWEADYRTYLENRRAYADRLRAGEDVPFSEAAVDAIPISEKLATFAADNEMSSCKPPTDV